MVKKILSILLWIATAGAVVMAFVIAHNKYMHSPLSRIELEIDRPNSSRGFVDFNTEYDRIHSICYATDSCEIASINVDTIVNLLCANPWVEKASASITLDGVLKVFVKEHIPIMRVYNRNQQSVYITSDGMVLPSSKLYSPDVMMINGNISFEPQKDKVSINDSVYVDSQLVSIFDLASAINNDRILKSTVAQVFISDNGEAEMVQYHNKATVLFGTLDNIADKLMRLRIFLEQKHGTDEMQDYKHLSLKFNNQVVCVKK